MNAKLMLAISYLIPHFSLHAAIFIFFYTLSKRHQKHLKLIYLRRVSKNSTKSPCRPCQANKRKELFFLIFLYSLRSTMMKRKKGIFLFFTTKLTEPKQTDYTKLSLSSLSRKISKEVFGKAIRCHGEERKRRKKVSSVYLFRFTPFCSIFIAHF